MSSEINYTSTNISSKSRPISWGIFGASAFIVLLIVVNFFHPLFLKNKDELFVLAYENDGKGRVFRGEVIDNMTILDALIASSKAGQIELNYGLDTDGKIMIESLDGYTRVATDKRLAFYVNNHKIDEGLINSTIIKPGDNIEVRLELK